MNRNHAKTGTEGIGHKWCVPYITVAGAVMLPSNPRHTGIEKALSLYRQ